MKFEIAILCVLIVASAISAQSNLCDDDGDDRQIVKVLKNANCKFKSGMSSIRDKFKKIFNNKKTDSLDFDEIDVVTDEEIIAMMSTKRVDEEGC